ncbi:MAG: hypothetical protein ACP5JT_02900 [Thermoplasmata archaeon]
MNLKWYHYLLIIVIILILIISSLYLYSGNWPPLTIIESDSMQHGSQFTWFVLNTGDIVIVKKISNYSDIVTYVQGRLENYVSYGDYGDVIIYYSNYKEPPIIHRAILYIEWSGKNFTFPGERNAEQQGWVIIKGYNIIILNVGPSQRNLIINVSMYIGQNGFITMGDNNLINSYRSNPNVIFPQVAYYAADQNIGISLHPVKLNDIEGKAVGWIPWFGAFRILLSGQSYYIKMIPVETYYYLGFVISLTIIIGYVADYIYYGKEKDDKDGGKN